MIAGKGLVFRLAKSKTFRTSNLQQVNVSSEEIKPSFDIIRSNGSIEIKANVKAGGLLLDLKDNEAVTPLFYIYNHQLFVWKDQQTSEVAENFFPGGSKKTSFSNWSDLSAVLLVVSTRSTTFPFFTTAKSILRLSPVSGSITLRPSESRRYRSRRTLAPLCCLLRDRSSVNSRASPSILF